VCRASVEFSDEELSPISIEFSHPFDMAEEKSFRDESSEGRLVNRGRVLIYHAPDLGQRIYQLFWRNETAQTQGGMEDLGHRPRVDHST